MMGGALGLAVLVAVSSARTGVVASTGTDPVTALNIGLHAAFLAGAVCAVAAAVVGGVFLRPKPMSPHGEHADPAEPVEELTASSPATR